MAKRLRGLEEIWIKEDARYFKEAGYIGDDMYRRVLGWLEGERTRKPKRRRPGGWRRTQPGWTGWSPPPYATSST
jgi:hypothetical protein